MSDSAFGGFVVNNILAGLILAIIACNKPVLLYGRHMLEK